MAGDRLLIRTASRLYCLTEGARLDAAAQARLPAGTKAATTADIWSAAAAGDGDSVTKLLAEGTAVNARQPGSGSTPLNSAVLSDNSPWRGCCWKRARMYRRRTRMATRPCTSRRSSPMWSWWNCCSTRGLRRAKNGRGETPLDVVSAEWSPQLEQTYRTIGDLVGIELDLARIKQERPKVAELLRRCGPIAVMVSRVWQPVDRERPAPAANVGSQPRFRHWGEYGATT